MDARCASDVGLLEGQVDYRALQRLLPRHYAMMDLALAGISYKDIAAKLGMTKVGVGRVINSNLFQEAMSRRREKLSAQIDDQLVSTIEEAKVRLEAAALEAAEKQVMLLDSDDDRVQQSAISSILDRVGIGKQELSGAGASVTVLNVVTLNNLQVALEESRGG